MSPKSIAVKVEAFSVFPAVLGERLLDPEVGDA
jgi:hypothetical protein